MCIVHTEYSRYNSEHDRTCTFRKRFTNYLRVLNVVKPIAWLHIMDEKTIRLQSSMSAFLKN